MGLRARRVQDRRGWAFGFVASVVKPSLRVLTRTQYVDGEKIPARGGFVLAANHLSYLDPLVLGLFVYDHGRLVRYLAKQEIFETPVLRTLARDAGQIPVRRLTQHAGSAYDAAVAAVRAGECVAFYPEGTMTRDPAMWPMTGRTGAARVALATGCPLVPVGQWGVQELWPPYGKPDVLPRKVLRLKAGDPVDLTDLQGSVLDAGVLRVATDRVMDAVTGLVSDLRGEPAPTVRFDPRVAGVREIGNPYRREDRQPHHRHHRHQGHQGHQGDQGHREGRG